MCTCMQKKMNLSIETKYNRDKKTYINLAQFINRLNKLSLNFNNLFKYIKAFTYHLHMFISAFIFSM